MATLEIGGRMENQSRYEAFMAGWRHVIQVSERMLIDNVAATVPWLAPLSPAYMIWDNAQKLLAWPVQMAWIVAAAVEGLGLSVISTAFMLWKEKRSTVWVAIVTAVFYFMVVIVVNVGLELGTPIWIAKALLSLLSVPAVVTMALRAGNAQESEQEAVKTEKEVEEKRQVEEREYQRKLEAEEREHLRKANDEERARKHELKLKRLSGKSPEGAESHREVAGEQEPVYRNWHEVPASEYGWIEQATTSEIVKKYRLRGKDPERQARNWKKYAKEAR